MHQKLLRLLIAATDKQWVSPNVTTTNDHYMRC